MLQRSRTKKPIDTRPDKRQEPICQSVTAGKVHFQFDVGNVVLRLVRFASVLDLTYLVVCIFYIFYTAGFLLHRFVVTQFVAADGYMRPSVTRVT